MTIDANDLERMAKERPDERFLKGSGVLKLTGAVRMLEGQMGVALALLNECVGPMEVSAALIEDEDGGEAIETLIERVKAFCAASYLNRIGGVAPVEAPSSARDRIAPLLNAFGELHWRSGRGQDVPHEQIADAFETIVAAAAGVKGPDHG